MSAYKSTPTIVNRKAEDIYAHFLDLSLFADRLSSLPDDVRAKLADVKFDKDSIAIMTPQVGELKFEVIRREEPTLVVFGSPSAPVPLEMRVELKPVGDDSTEVMTVIDVEIPAMLKPFVGPKLQQAADQFGAMIANLSR